MLGNIAPQGQLQNLITMDFDKTICKTDLGSVVETIVLTMAQDEEQFQKLPQSVKDEINEIKNNINIINESKNKWLNEIKEEINQERGVNGDEERKTQLEQIGYLLKSTNESDQEKITTMVQNYAIAKQLQSRTKEDADKNGDEIKMDINEFILRDVFKQTKLNDELLNNALACVMPARNFLSKNLANDVVNGIKSLQKSEYKQLLDPKMVEIAKENPTVITSFNRNSHLMREILDKSDLQNVKIVYHSLQNCTGKEFAGCRPLFKFIHGLAVQESDGNTLETTNDINELIKNLPKTSFAKRFNDVLGEFAQSQDKSPLSVSRNGYQKEQNDLQIIFKLAVQKVLEKSENVQQDVARLNSLLSSITLVDDHHKTILPFVAKLPTVENGAVQSKDVIDNNTFQIQINDKLYSILSPNVAVPVYYTKQANVITNIHGHEHRVNELKKQLTAQKVKAVNLRPQLAEKLHINRMKSARFQNFPGGVSVGNGATLHRPETTKRPKTARPKTATPKTRTI